MKNNMSMLDRSLRAILGLLVMVVGFVQESSWGAVGLFPLLTAYLGICPIYHWLHYSSHHPLQE
jgi:Protein of unknown function (DUF2892)